MKLFEILSDQQPDDDSLFERGYMTKEKALELAKKAREIFYKYEKFGFQPDHVPNRFEVPSPTTPVDRAQARYRPEDGDIPRLSRRKGIHFLTDNGARKVVNDIADALTLFFLEELPKTFSYEKKPPTYSIRGANFYDFSGKPVVGISKMGRQVWFKIVPSSRSKLQVYSGLPGFPK